MIKHTLLNTHVQDASLSTCLRTAVRGFMCVVVSHALKHGTKSSLNACLHTRLDTPANQQGRHDGRNYIGHNYIGHNYRGHNYIGDGRTWNGAAGRGANLHCCVGVRQQGDEAANRRLRCTLVRAYIVMDYIVMAYIVMAYIVMV